MKLVETQFLNNFFDEKLSKMLGFLCFLAAKKHKKSTIFGSFSPKKMFKNCVST